MTPGKRALAATSAPDVVAEKILKKRRNVARQQQHSRKCSRRGANTTATIAASSGTSEAASMATLTGISTAISRAASEAASEAALNSTHERALDVVDKQQVNGTQLQQCVIQILQILDEHQVSALARSCASSIVDDVNNLAEGIEAQKVQEEQETFNTRRHRVAEYVRQAVNDTPFVQMLSSMAVPNKGMQIPLISRKYEEKFMRACIDAQEKPCSMQKQCEAMFINPEQAFVCMRFQIPNVSGKEVENNTLCILCLRKQTLLLFYRTMHAGYDPGVLIQRHGNICNEPGEYSRSAMIFANPNGPIQCMPLPIVAHQRNRYQVLSIAGIKHLRQIGVGVNDENAPFRQPPVEF